ncbi:fasciclin domain-containing protein [Aeromicrobium sp. IC_218]|uniref:fasciclin domain-containing protein n=1 Tax=Aeromicrobium sp. IC_218 TaxID=2545468 RepID=UPI00103C1F1A|nr:fasciclin domain-containing protein [Aeromicrobium sp. IC_218]TCI97725.1 fasciclin domain-containing protein [Aeromicrobium sp. IC_218]
MRTTTRLKNVVAGVALVSSLGLLTAACGSDDTDSSSSSSSSSATPSEEMTESEGMVPASDLVGAGCADYAEQVPDGAGSVEGMAMDPVTTAASNNPLLKTLTAAVSGQLNPDVNLVDTLNGGEFTVFAPVDDAFAKIDAKTLETLKTPEGAKTLESILTYHVVPGRMAPADVAGTHKTANGAEVTVEGSGDDLTVGSDGAKVICGGVQTQNATVYLIDSVLMPPM